MSSDRPRSTIPRRPGEQPQLTAHAIARMQQRWIGRPLLEALLVYGAREHDRGGCRKLFFDHRVRQRLAAREGRIRYRQLERGLDAYAVPSGDGVVVTVRHRSRRIQRR